MGTIYQYLYTDIWFFTLPDAKNMNYNGIQKMNGTFSDLHPHVYEMLKCAKRLTSERCRSFCVYVGSPGITLQYLKTVIK